MEVKLGATVSYFLWSFFAGVLLALLYDCFRSSRRIFRTSVLGVTFEDVLFFLIAGGVLFVTAFYKNGGRLRFQGFGGVIFGFLLYRRLMKDRIVRMMVWIYQKAVCLFIFILKIILFPLRMVSKVLSKPFLVIGWYSKQGVKRAERVFRTIKARQNLTEKRKKADQKRRQKHVRKSSGANENFR